MSQNEKIFSVSNKRNDECYDGYVNWPDSISATFILVFKYNSTFNPYVWFLYLCIIRPLKLEPLTQTLIYGMSKEIVFISQNQTENNRRVQHKNLFYLAFMPNDYCVRTWCSIVRHSGPPRTLTLGFFSRSPVTKECHITEERLSHQRLF
jgi:hypothetical protein